MNLSVSCSRAESATNCYVTKDVLVMSMNICYTSYQLKYVCVYVQGNDAGAFICVVY